MFLVPSREVGCFCDADQRTGSRVNSLSCTSEATQIPAFLYQGVCESPPSAFFEDVCCSVSEHYDAETAFSPITRRETGCRSEAGEGRSGRLPFVYSC